MATSTNGLAATKPAASEQYDVGVFNDNADLFADLLLGGHKGSDISSASSITLPSAGSVYDITGTTTITAISAAKNYAGRVVLFQFDGILQLTHNSGSFNLPTGANITTAAGDRAIFVSEGSNNWRCAIFQRASGGALAIADNSVDSDAYVDGSIDTAHVADNQITLAKLSDGTQGGVLYYGASGAPTELAAGTDGYVLATNGSSANPAWEQVSGTGIANDAIDSQHYADTSIDTGHIADNQVTLAKLSDGTQGGILYYGSGGAPTELSAGTSGHFLKTQGGSANPVWAAAASGGFTQKVVNVSFFGMTGNGSSGGAIANNDAFYMPIDVMGDMTITKISFYIQTSSGNIDVGLYNASGTKLVSAGSTSSPGTGVRTISVASTDISSGQHYLALAVDNTTFKWGQTTGADTMATRMMQRETSDFPLPSSFTVGAWPTSLSSSIGPPGMVLS